MTEVIRDKTGNKVGEIVADGGKLKARDRVGNTLGHYDPKTGKTTDKNGNTVAQGNILSALIWITR